LVPLMVSVKVCAPAIIELGVKLVIVGLGGLTVNAVPAEDPPELVAIMLAVPAAAIRLAGTDAVICVALIYVVVSEAPPQLAVEVEVKFAPLMVRVKAAPPAIVADGLKLEMVGGRVMLVTAAKAVPLAVPELVIRPEMVGGGLPETADLLVVPLAELDTAV